MSVSFELKEGLVLPGEVKERLTKFFADDACSSQSAHLRTREDSLDSTTSSLDAEKPAGADDWNPLINDEEAVLPEECFSTWLSSCLISTFSSLEYMLIANGAKWALLARTPIDESRLGVVFMCSVESILPLNEQDSISSCYLFALSSSRHTELRDCLIVALGMSNGYVAFLTEKGTLLFTEQFSVDLPILSVTFDQFEDAEVFTVVTSEDVFCINSFSLHSVLTQSKTAIAKGEKTSLELSEKLELDMQRLELESRSRLSHAVFTGFAKPSPFQQYVSASVDDFNQEVKNLAPNYYTFFVNTERMFGTFAWHKEGDGGSSISETVSKITSSFVPHFGLRKFLGIPTPQEKKRALSRPRGTALARGVLNDSRSIASISRAPCPRSLIAVVDQTARVLLIDVRQRQIVRIWKSYRDASVAWVSSSSGGRGALFLVVFAPRRSLIEVWNVQNGARVGAQHVDPAGLLLNGGQASVIGGRRELADEAKAFFFDSQGCIHEIVVPFSLALMKNTSLDDHDQLILSNMPVEGVECTADAVSAVFSVLRTQKGRRQALLRIFRVVTDATTFSHILNRIKEGEEPGLPMDLIDKMHNYLSVFDKMISYGSEASVAAVQLTVSEESKVIIDHHLHLGNSRTPVVHTLDSFFPFIDIHEESTGILKMNVNDADLLTLCDLIFTPVLIGSIDSARFLDEFVPKLPYSMEDLVGLLRFFLLNTEFAMADYFGNLVHLIAELCEDTHSMFTLLEKSALDSVHTSRALLLYMAVHTAKKMLVDKAAERPVDGDACDWESFDPSVEYTDCTISILHANWLCSNIQPGASYFQLLGGGGGYFRERIATWVVEKEYDASQLESQMGTDDNLHTLVQLLPRTTEKSLLFADCAWELASLWFKNRTEKFDNLSLATSYLCRIEDARLEHGVARLIWDKFLSDILEALSGLIEKRGRPPKEREALQALQLQERHLVPFLDQCNVVLDCLLDSVREAPSLSTIPVDHLLEVALSHPPQSAVGMVTTRDSLAHLATRQSLVNYHLVQHYAQLVTVYKLQIATSLRIRPLSTVFCPIGQRAFFNGLDTYPLLPMEKVDDVVLEQRHSFLSKVADEGGEEESQIARNLAHQWCLTVDSIALVQVISLLRNGKDDSAGREVSLSNNPQLGMRLARLLAARTLRLAAEEGTALTSIHNKYLADLAGEEFSRVDWDGDWRQAVRSLARMAGALSLPFDAATAFERICTITSQYWGIQGHN